MSNLEKLDVVSINQLYQTAKAIGWTPKDEFCDLYVGNDLLADALKETLKAYYEKFNVIGSGSQFKDGKKVWYIIYKESGKEYDYSYKYDELQVTSKSVSLFAHRHSDSRF